MSDKYLMLLSDYLSLMEYFFTPISASEKEATASKTNNIVPLPVAGKLLLPFLYL